jgi:hypothetical protein
MKKVTIVTRDNRDKRDSRDIFKFLNYILLFCCLLPSALNAQVNENIILDTVDIQKNELIVTPELEEAVVTQIKNWPESFYSDYGIKSKAQLEHLQIGKPISQYAIVNEKQNAWLQSVNIYNVSRMSDGKPLFLEFRNNWLVPIISDGEPLLFVAIQFTDFGDPYIFGIKNTNTIEHFYEYEYKNLLIGSLGRVILSDMREMDFLIIWKDNQVLFVEVYDKITGEYFKNEYGFSELINHIKELGLREKEAQDRAQNRYYAQVADKSELKMTPEITEMLLTQAYSSRINDSDEHLSHFGIKNRAQLEHLHLGKPIPRYIIVNDNLTFVGKWDVPVMSAGESLFMISVRLGDDEQYKWSGSSGAAMAEIIRNYEHKDLLIGFLGASREWDYFIIRKNNKDIFVKMYDSVTREYLKNEYSFSEVLNLLKK